MNELSLFSNQFINISITVFTFTATLGVLAYYHQYNTKKQLRKLSMNQDQDEKTINKFHLPVTNVDDVNELDNLQIQLASFNIVKYIESENPDYIIGINNTGATLATILSGYLNHIEFSANRVGGFHLSTIDNIPGSNSTEIKFPPEMPLDRKNLRATILLLDDICRTGESLQYARKRLSQEMPLAKLLITTLVSVVSESGCNKLINYAPVRTRNKYLLFPWTTPQRVSFLTEIRKKESSRDTTIGKEVEITQTKRKYSSVEDGFRHALSGFDDLYKNYS